MRNRLIQNLLCLLCICISAQAQEDSISSNPLNKGQNVPDSLMLEGNAYDPIFLVKGKVAGASVSKLGGHPGAPHSMIIRGLSSIYFSQNPMYVIDGVEGVDINMIHPDDIYSMEMLNNISSAARYGNLGGNGVVIVKTRNAIIKKPLCISYRSFISFDQTANTYELLTAQGIRDYAAKIEEENPWYQFEDGGADVDYQKEMFRNTASHSHHLSGSGIINNTSYYASMSYKSQPGLIQHSNSERIGGNLKISQSFFDKRLRIRAMGAYNQQKINGLDEFDSFGILKQTYWHNPTDPVYNEDGTYYNSPRAWKYYNPMEVNDVTERETVNRQLLGSLEVDFEIVEHLVLKLSASYRELNLESSLFKPEIQGNFVYPLEINTEMAEYDKQLSGSVGLNYSRSFIKAHTLSAEIGYTYCNKRAEFLEGRGLQPYRYLVFKRSDGDTSRINNSINSVYANVGYNFKQRYHLDAGLRYDMLFPSIERMGSLASDPIELEDIGNIYPFVSMGWDISNENFLRDQDWLSMLMISGGYGVAGKENNLYTLEENTKIAFEEAKEYNAKLDFGLWQNRLHGNLTCYWRESYQIFAYKPLPVPPNVYPFIHDNTTEVTNQGVEINLASLIVDKKNIRYFSSFTISHNVNTIRFLQDGGEIRHNQIDYTDYDSYTQQFSEGQSLFAFYLPQFAEFNEGQMVFIRKDGGHTYYISQAERVYTNTVMPNWEVAWGNQLNIYKNIDFSFSLRYIQGHSVYREAKMYLESVYAPIRNVLADAIDLAPFNPQVADYFLEDASYLRLDNIALSYTFNLKKINPDCKLRLVLGANNLFTLTEFEGLDPEINYNTLYPGVEKSYVYPPVRSYFLSLNFTI